MEALSTINWFKNNNKKKEESRDGWRREVRERKRWKKEFRFVRDTYQHLTRNVNFMYYTHTNIITKLSTISKNR